MRKTLPVIGESEAIRLIHANPGRYVMWLGAGLSAEAGVLTAAQISRTVRESLERSLPDEIRMDASKLGRWADEELRWSDPARRYTQALDRAYPSEALRLAWFRQMLDRYARPAFCHHAVALLMKSGRAARTALTTNFDHLLEAAFAIQGITGSQAIRSDHEVPYWNRDSDRLFLLKLHGDIDTQNILNTPDETLHIGDVMREAAESALENAGLVVLGTSGSEKSIRRLLEDLEKRVEKDRNFLGFGLLWGVYMGSEHPGGAVDDADLAARVRQRAEAGEVHEGVVELMDRQANRLFRFFPMWGAGDFLHRVVRDVPDRMVVARAERYLDHEMRLQETFARGSFQPATIARHIAELRRRRKALEEKLEQGSSRRWRSFGRAILPGTRIDFTFVHGDMSSRSLLAAMRGNARAAVISADDQYLSVGGGVALSLLEKAGRDALLYEISKFSPVAHGSIVVTSAGELPTHYIFHAAALEIQDGPAYNVTPADLRNVLLKAFETADALDVTSLTVPLIGSGMGVLTARQSLESIVNAALEWSDGGARPVDQPLSIAVVILDEEVLGRREVEEALVAAGAQYEPVAGQNTAAELSA